MVKSVEYEFTTANGQKKYEQMTCSMDIARACRIFDAISYRPVNPTERVPMFRTIKESV
jgi:hypothetical protein